VCGCLQGSQGPRPEDYDTFLRLAQQEHRGEQETHSNSAEQQSSGAVAEQTSGTGFAEFAQPTTSQQHVWSAEASPAMVALCEELRGLSVARQPRRWKSTAAAIIADHERSQAAAKPPVPGNSTADYSAELEVRLSALTAELCALSSAELCQRIRALTGVDTHVLVGATEGAYVIVTLAAAMLPHKAKRCALGRSTDTVSCALQMGKNQTRRGRGG
jgi:hypothetical protein